jgi:iron complex outermembrane receptor protein
MRNNYLKKFTLLISLFVMSAVAFAQTGSISGKVVDETNQPLPAATVVIKGTAKSTATDINGNYKLTGVANGQVTLEFRFLGYQTTTQVVNINGATTLNVALKPGSATNLNEVVVIGYGTARKKDLTGSLTTVSSKDFQQGSITTPEQLISGKVAGVAITSNGGAPGSGSTIRIRGGASLRASNDPLIVIDGVQLSNDGVSGASNALSLINPDDIETFTVLKDASATAIYGSRASNGVILITTKKGSTNSAPVVNFNTQASLSTLPKEADVLSADQIRTFVNKYSTVTGYPDLRSKLGTANTDWQKEIYQNAFATNNNLSVSGGTKHMPYRASVGYLNQDGILKTGNLQRLSGAIGVTPRFFNDHLKVDINVKGTDEKNKFANQGAIGSAVSFDPTQSVLSGNKNFGGYFEYLDPSATTGLKSLSPLNPVGLLNQREDKSDVQRSIGNMQLDYKFHFLPDLHANLNLGYDVSKGTGTIFVPDYAASNFMQLKDDAGVLHGGISNQYKQVVQNTSFEFYLNYVKDIKAINSHIDLTAGYAFYDYNTTIYNFQSHAADGATNATLVPNFPYTKPENALRSFYGRLNYTLADKYLLTATVRQDNSSKFAADYRSAVFPSASLGWAINQESFLKDSKTISNLKLRVGYGLTGQQDGIPYYDYVSYYSLSDQKAEYQFGNNFYQLYRPGGFYANRKWEQSATTNVGIDYGFFNGRISGAIDLYYKNTIDLLNQVAQPAGANFSNTIVANVGNMVNRGVEFSINTQLMKTKDLNWDLNLNATYNENKITKLNFLDDGSSAGQLTGGISGGTGRSIQINSVGYARNTFYPYQQVYGSNGLPLDAVFVDRNGDGTINEKDEYRYKTPDPKYFLGISSNVSYKKFSAGFSGRANIGNYVYNNVFSGSGTINSIMNPLGIINNGSTSVLESSLSGKDVNNSLSDYYIENASFFRMDNMNIGYNFGRVYKNTANIRLSFNVQNVFVITNYKGVDPEVSSGIDNNVYPRPRTFVLGLNVGF